MYAWLWRHLPGGTALRTCSALVLLFVVVSLLWCVVFPWADGLLRFDDVTVR